MFERDLKLDILKTFIILTMIFAHAYSSFPIFRPYSNILSFINFIVVGFVFTSGMSLVKKTFDFSKLNNSVEFLKKRLTRLLLPYWVWVTINPINGVLTGAVNDKLFNVYFLFGFETTHFLYGWLILLFVLLSFTFPIIYAYRKSFVTPVVLSLISLAGYFVLIPQQNIFIVASYLPVFWLGMYVGEKKDFDYKKLGLVLGSVYLITTWFFMFLEKPLGIYANKHPASPLFLFYGLTVMLFSLSFFSFFKFKDCLKCFFESVSKNSLNIFLIHFTIIKLVL